ncbi:hypothetical protein Bpfe_011228 [Biomphalaria pfeifferi]|uniref:Uncharacterized protein n=1 Tax=Biomphalaria pfeifferi TaxID=112525 RepID=A0AAD8BRE3_BIOPF|nr:hypothetical protein Bpfe_011228 [Biomphalaria pfeifferi]
MWKEVKMELTGHGFNWTRSQASNWTWTELRKIAKYSPAQCSIESQGDKSNKLSKPALLTKCSVERDNKN